MGKLNQAKEVIDRLEKISEQIEQLRYGYIKITKAMTTIGYRQNTIAQHLQKHFPQLKITRKIEHESKIHKETTCICKHMWLSTLEQDTGEYEYLCSFCGQREMISDGN